MIQTCISSRPRALGTRVRGISPLCVFSVVSGRRYYSPFLGRWHGRDPIEEQGGLNLYAFCHNDAVNLWDKDGCIVPLAMVAAGLGSVAFDFGLQMIKNGGDWRQTSMASLSVSFVAGATGFGFISVGKNVFNAAKVIQAVNSPASKTVWSVVNGGLVGTPVTTAVRQSVIDKVVDSAGYGVAGNLMFQAGKAAISLGEAAIRSDFGSASSKTDEPVVMAPFIVTGTIPKGTLSQQSAVGTNASTTNSMSAISIAGGTSVSDPESIAEALAATSIDSQAAALEEAAKVKASIQL